MMSPRQQKTSLTAKTITAYGISSIIAAASAFGAIHKVIYTHDEGRALERRVNQMEADYREDIREVRKSLELIWMAVKK
jgi:hypothetical protein